jgi:hypothetical protein
VNALLARLSSGWFLAYTIGVNVFDLAFGLSNVVESLLGLDKASVEGQSAG